MPPLKYAVAFGPLKVVRMLLEAGANPLIATEEFKETPLAYATSAKKSSVDPERLAHWTKMETLLLKYT